MNLTSFRKIAGLCLFVAASVPLANLSHAQGMNPNFVVDRLDSLVHLNSAQRAAAIDIVTRENSALQAFAPGQERAIKGMPIRQAARALGSWRLTGLTLVVTLEPCTMCAGAVTAARLARVVYGAEDPKAGAVGSLWDVLRDARLNHRPEVIGGVLGGECGALLRDFFAARRPHAR